MSGGGINGIGTGPMGSDLGSNPYASTGQFANPLFNEAPQNPYAPAAGFMNPLFMSAPLQNAPVPYVQQPSSMAPPKPTLTLKQQLDQYMAGGK